MKTLLLFLWLGMFAIFGFFTASTQFPDETIFKPEIPRTWDSAALADFMLPLPDTTVIVKPISAEYYYSLPVRTIYKSYPMYHPDYEPEGYLDSLRQLKPEVAFDPSQLKTEEDWIRAGEVVFDAPHIFASVDDFFNAEGLAKGGIPHTKEGIFPYQKYIIDEKGELRIGFAACGNCHTKVMPDGSVIKGAQGNFKLDHMLALFVEDREPSSQLEDVLKRMDAELFHAPWINHFSAQCFDTLTLKGYIRQHKPTPAGVLMRQGTHYFYPARIPDLRSLSDELYLDATGHMQNRSLEDVMRYAAFNENVDLLTRYDNFIPVLREHTGPLPPPDSIESLFNGPFDRFTDEQLYALALYLYSLEPVPSPHTFDQATMERGERVFIEQGCVTCHTPPLYTNNRLTPVDGFTPPADHFGKYRIFDISVETDPGLALYTRRGTGYYKVPSLRGLWYRSPLLHDGSLTTLEELLDPKRLEDSFVPSGFKEAGVKTKAVKGHPFGLELNEEDKNALIAYMKTL